MILVGDVGGTNARLALFEAGQPQPVRADTLPSGSFPSLEAAVRAFLGASPPPIEAATFGIAGPVVRGRAKATNLPWEMDEQLLAKALAIPRVRLLNDLVALSFGALTVPGERLRVLQVGAPEKTGATVAMIAAGTGLGEAALVWDSASGMHVPLPTEGGHTDFAPRDALEWELAEHLRRKFGGHVSWERIVAGPGISTLYEFFRDEKKMGESKEVADKLAALPDQNARNKEIAALGVGGRSETAARAMHLFASLYGVEAGNLALKTLSTGGVFVAGGIAARYAELLAKGSFVESFVSKGRFRPLLEKMPIAIVMDTDIGLAGSAFFSVQSGARPSH